MSDPLDPSDAGADPSRCENEPGEAYPWDEPAAADDPDAPRQRHDAFTLARKNEFLKALVKTGGIQDACRKAGVSPRTVYRHQQDDSAFFDNCCLALRMSATPIELTAWSRAVEGVEQEFACGGQVHVRRRYDAGLLRLLLQGSNPKKYGPRPGFKRKRMLKYERRLMEREIRNEIAANRKGPPDRTFEEVRESILRKIEAIERHREPEKLAAGWTKTPDGEWVPPGYGPIPGWQPPAAPDEGSAEAGGAASRASDPPDSM